MSVSSGRVLKLALVVVGESRCTKPRIPLFCAPCLVFPRRTNPRNGGVQVGSENGLSCPGSELSVYLSTQRLVFPSPDDVQISSVYPPAPKQCTASVLNQPTPRNADHLLTIQNTEHPNRFSYLIKQTKPDQTAFHTSQIQEPTSSPSTWATKPRARTYPPPAVPDRHTPASHTPSYTPRSPTS